MVSDLGRIPMQGISPTNSVAQFRNQQPVFAGRPGTQASSFLPRDSVGGRGGGRTAPVSLGQQLRSKTNDTVRLGAERMTGIFQANQQSKRAQEADTARLAGQAASQVAVTPVAQVGTGGNMSKAGKAWKADGSLSESRNAVLADASSYLGSRYVLGGRSYKGIDCSGLVMNVYNKMGMNVSQHHAGWQGRNIPGVRTSIKNLRPGDIVAWRDGSHIAIYAGNGEMIEAANPRTGTVRRRIWANESLIFGIAVRLPGE